MYDIYVKFPVFRLLQEGYKSGPIGHPSNTNHRRTMAKSETAAKKTAPKKSTGAPKKATGGVKKVPKKEPGTGRKASPYHIKNPAINKMIRAGGNPAVSKKVLPHARSTLNVLLENIVSASRIYVQNAGRKTYQESDAKNAVRDVTGMVVV